MSSLSEAAGRLLGRSQTDHERYAFCPEDRYWFRPAYTEGKCPLCGEPVPGGAAAPLFQRVDRSWFGVGLLALESAGMIALVLLMYFKG